MSFKTIKSRYLQLQNRLVKLFKKNALLSFAAVLVLLFIVIAVGNALRKPVVTEAPTDTVPKEVHLYQIGTVPRVQVQAQVQKSGVIAITAQAGGVISDLPVEEGQTIAAGTRVASLASTYSGGNLLSKQRQIASAQYTFNQENYDTQVELIEQQKRLAELNADNQGELRKISEESLDRTKTIIDSTKSNLELLDSMIAYYKNSVATSDISDFSQDESQLLGLEQQRLGLLNALQAAEQARKSTEYSLDGDKAAVQLTDLTKDTSLKQLDLQKKTLELNLEISKLNVQLAQINESLMYPVAPFTGTVERVHVKKGQAVTPGTVLITFSGSDNSSTAVALVSQTIAEQLSRIEPSLATINNTSFEVYPSYVSTEATNNRLFSVIFPIMLTSSVGSKGYDATLADSLHVADGQYITIELPIGYSNSPSSFAFVPLDAVYQTQDSAYVFIAEDGRAVSREVTLGNIFGRYVEVTTGLHSADQIILDRTVLAGDAVVQK